MKQNSESWNRPMMIWSIDLSVKLPKQFPKWLYHLIFPLTTLEIGLAVFRIAKYVLTLYLSNSTFRYLTSRNEKICTQRDKENIPRHILVKVASFKDKKNYITSIRAKEVIHKGKKSNWHLQHREIERIQHWQNTKRKLPSQDIIQNQLIYNGKRLYHSLAKHNKDACSI